MGNPTRHYMHYAASRTPDIDHFRIMDSSGTLRRHLDLEKKSGAWVLIPDGQRAYRLHGSPDEVECLLDMMDSRWGRGIDCNVALITLKDVSVLLSLGTKNKLPSLYDDAKYRLHKSYNTKFPGTRTTNTVGLIQFTPGDHIRTLALALSSSNRRLRESHVKLLQRNTPPTESGWVTTNKKAPVYLTEDYASSELTLVERPKY
ncbi:hypothetical protein BV25DRAFT_1835947 [Artomyces pyxidatus]|uniref:Uncharacterized protein n=1 Tax=Artomyces pyxidatus TaxID=48021 RepID=A0ACB8TD66_9AGAM|nr:hypothetical protein BV25DRAFT_1835947 [Artomyces pyxidatus]